MGIGPAIVTALIREHLYKPIRGDVQIIGRQTVYFTPRDRDDLRWPDVGLRPAPLRA